MGIADTKSFLCREKKILYVGRKWHRYKSVLEFFFLWTELTSIRKNTLLHDLSKAQHSSHFNYSLVETKSISCKKSI
jgi:hypothetical protein